MKTAVGGSTTISPGCGRWAAGDASGRRLLEVCGSFYERLRRSVQLTFFRIELQHEKAPLVVSLHSPDALAWPDPRHDWMRAGPARLECVIRGDDQRVLAYLLIEDDRRVRYPEDARTTCERIAGDYRSELGELLSPAAATSRPFRSTAAVALRGGGAVADPTDS